MSAPAATPEPTPSTSTRLGLRAFLRGALVFLALSALGLAAVAGVVPDFLALQTLDLRPLPAALAVALVPALWGLDAARYALLARGLGQPLGWGLALRLVFVYHTAAFLTPGSGGGQPVLVWYLLRRGAPVERAAALALVKPLLAMAVVTAGGLLALALHPSPPPGLSWAIAPGVVVFTLLLLLLAALFLRPDLAARALLALLRPLGALPRLGPRLAGERARGAVERTVATLSDLRRRGAGFLLANVALTLAWYAVGVTAIGAIVLAVGAEPGALELGLDLALLRVVAIYAPTPGAAGFAEGAIAWCFDPARALAIVAGYRLLLYYSEILIGLPLIGRELARRGRTPPQRVE